MTPDDVCNRFTKAALGFSIKIIDKDPNVDGAGVPMMSIEGSAKALNFLAEILAAVANSEACSTFSISPDGPGNAHFSGASTHGIYLRRT